MRNGTRVGHGTPPLRGVPAARRPRGTVQGRLPLRRTVVARLPEAHARAGCPTARRLLGCTVHGVTDALQWAQDAADIALCEEIKARCGPGIPHDEVMAMLDADDDGN